MAIFIRVQQSGVQEEFLDPLYQFKALAEKDGVDVMALNAFILDFLARLNELRGNVSEAEKLGKECRGLRKVISMEYD